MNMVLCKIWGFHGDKNLSWPSDCDIMLCCGRISMFWRAKLPHLHQSLPKLWYPTTSLCDLTMQQTMTWNMVLVFRKYTTILQVSESEEIENQLTKIHDMIWATFSLCWSSNLSANIYQQCPVISTTFTYPIQWRHKVVIAHNGKSQECICSSQHVYYESPWLSSLWPHKRHWKLLYSRRCAILSARMHCRDPFMVCRHCGLGCYFLHTEANASFSDLWEEENHFLQNRSL